MRTWHEDETRSKIVSCCDVQSFGRIARIQQGFFSRRTKEAPNGPPNSGGLETYRKAIHRQNKLGWHLLHYNTHFVQGNPSFHPSDSSCPLYYHRPVGNPFPYIPKEKRKRKKGRKELEVGKIEITLPVQTWCSKLSKTRSAREILEFLSLSVFKTKVKHARCNWTKRTSSLMLLRPPTQQRNGR